jgi:hypothetical protein
MGACRGYCLPEVPAEEYRASIDDAVLIIEGKSEELKSSWRARCAPPRRRSL